MTLQRLLWQQIQYRVCLHENNISINWCYIRLWKKCWQAQNRASYTKWPEEKCCATFQWTVSLTLRLLSLSSCFCFWKPTSEFNITQKEQDYSQVKVNVCSFSLLYFIYTVDVEEVWSISLSEVHRFSSPAHKDGCEMKIAVLMKNFSPDRSEGDYWFLKISLILKSLV